MRFLLDTQIFIWWDSEPERLPPRLLAYCEDPTNALVLSVASVWEMQIKSQLGKLDLDRPLAAIIEEHQQENLLELLPIELPHVLALEQLPLYHKDPFDRVIVAQAIMEQLTILSVDSLFAHYPVTVYGDR
ncbi:MAG: PIN domain nuclease [Chloroflexi bacterium]|nr:MAG: PIN domain nuclease [Chloroflexota bacterium]